MTSQFSNDDEALILASIDRFLEREVAPHAHALEATDTWPEAIVDQMKELGLFGATIDPEYGGLGLPAVTYARIVERVSAVWMSVSGIFNSHLIEPDCGTDLQAVRTKAIRDGDDYVVNGTKTWISNSIQGHILAVLVKTDLRAQPPRRGMSLLLVEKSPGFEVSRKLEKIGYKGIDSGELVFNDCRVPADNLIGGEEGRGLNQILAGLELGRINVAARGVGIARACLDESVAYSQVRKTFGKPICEHQSIQIKLAEMATRLEASRLLVEAAAQAYDEGRRCDMEAGMAKLFATETAIHNSLEAMRLHGAYGYSKEFNIERYYRDAPLLAIGEGTNELQRIIIAKQLVERNPA
jgi:alkylation response protein AidB-like acyl-CoA dehydrogenase